MGEGSVPDNHKIGLYATSISDIDDAIKDYTSKFNSPIFGQAEIKEEKLAFGNKQGKLVNIRYAHGQSNGETLYSTTKAAFVAHNSKTFVIILDEKTYSHEFDELIKTFNFY